MTVNVNQKSKSFKNRFKSKSQIALSRSSDLKITHSDLNRDL